MDLLQSFMGCMYPGSIRTESIESMDYPDYRFQVKNIDDNGVQVSEGELHLTDRDLIYFRPAKIPVRWPLNSIRRYGSDGETKFLFEAGRSSQREGIFAFQLNKSTELNRICNRVKETMQKLSQNNEFNLINRNNAILTRNQYVPEIPSYHNCIKQLKDVSTSTEDNQNQFNQTNINLIEQPSDDGADPRPLSYVLIDFDTTKALNESAQAHAASRNTNK